MATGRTTYVESYVRSDGTKVKGHVRHVHGEEGGGRGSQGGQGHGGRTGSSASSASGEWSQLPGSWRDGAGKSKPPKGGIDSGRLSGGATYEIDGGMLHMTMPMPVSAPEHPTIEEVTVRMSDPATQEMLVATYKRGQVSRTRNQRKWLAAELSDEDREQLARDYDESVICSRKIVYMSKHLKDKISRGELSVPQDVVEETIKNFSDSFLEYNVTEHRGQPSRRMLLRNNNVTRKVNVRGQVQDANLCIVLDIDTCCMITAYWNAADDHHDTLNRNRYEQGQPRRNGTGNGSRFVTKNKEDREGRHPNGNSVGKATESPQANSDTSPANWADGSTDDSRGGQPRSDQGDRPSSNRKGRRRRRRRRR